MVMRIIGSTLVKALALTAGMAMAQTAIAQSGWDLLLLRAIQNLNNRVTQLENSQLKIVDSLDQLVGVSLTAQTEGGVPDAYLQWIPMLGDDGEPYALRVNFDGFFQTTIFFELPDCQGQAGAQSWAATVGMLSALQVNGAIGYLVDPSLEMFQAVSARGTDGICSPNSQSAFVATPVLFELDSFVPPFRPVILP